MQIAHMSSFGITYCSTNAFFSLIFQAAELRKLNVKIQSSTKSSVRTAIVIGRCCKQREALKSSSQMNCTGSLVLIFQGDESIVGGQG